MENQNFTAMVKSSYYSNVYQYCHCYQIVNGLELFRVIPFINHNELHEY